MPFGKNGHPTGGLEGHGGNVEKTAVHQRFAGLAKFMSGRSQARNGLEWAWPMVKCRSDAGMLWYETIEATIKHHFLRGHRGIYGENIRGCPVPFDDFQPRPGPAGVGRGGERV
jgi:hypothetical protein